MIIIYCTVPIAYIEIIIIIRRHLEGITLAYSDGKVMATEITIKLNEMKRSRYCKYTKNVGFFLVCQ